MSRPLVADPRRHSEANLFHRACFRAHGKRCYFCGSKSATDAMHIISRAFLGPRRYECPIENARPGCRACHDKQTRGELVFKKEDVRRAIAALNKVCKCKLELP